MATVIESMTGVRINSPFFRDPVTLELFPDISKNGTSPKRNRVALLYGTNGSGKSTLLNMIGTLDNITSGSACSIRKHGKNKYKLCDSQVATS